MIESTPPSIDKLFRRHPVKRYKRGQVLLLSGEFPSRVFYLLEGTVKQYDVSYRGDEIVVNVFRPGAFFPMLYVLTSLPNPYCLEAETDITIIDAPASEVYGYLQSHSEVALELLATVYRGVDNMLRRMTHLLGGSTNGRIIYELLIEVRRFGHQTTDGAYHLGITESDLAARVGLSRETVSREISKMKRAGLLRSGPHIVVQDYHQLEAKLGTAL